jgi:hypothetical protein
MKSPWQLGLLALAVTGVSSYDFLYFKNYRSQKQASIQAIAPLPALGMVEAPLSPLAQPVAPSNDAVMVGDGSLPQISRDEINRLAQQAFISKELSETESESTWPRRDPFGSYSEPVKASRAIPIKSPIRDVSPPELLPLPQCVFSGTLIEQKYRLALVDGVPLSIGDRLGTWKLARIEPDYIILEAGNRTHRIELAGMGSQVAHRKESL